MTRIIGYHRVYDLPEKTGDVQDELCISREAFEQQMTYLEQQGYIPVTMNNIFVSHNPAFKTVAITFDDGYADNFYHALPILNAHRMNATFFIATTQLDRQQPFTWLRMSEKSQRLALNNEHWLPLSSRQVAAMAKQGMCFGSHLHYDVKARMDLQLIESRQRLESITGQQIFAYCYPFGLIDDYLIESVKAAGFKCAVGNAYTGGRYALRRLAINGSDSFETFKRKLSGTYDWPKYCLTRLVNAI